MKSSHLAHFVSIICHLCHPSLRCSLPPPCQWIDTMCSCIESLITSQRICVWEWCVCVCVWVSNYFSPRFCTSAAYHYKITERYKLFKTHQHTHLNLLSVPTRKQQHMDSLKQQRAWTSTWMPDILEANFRCFQRRQTASLTNNAIFTISYSTLTQSTSTLKYNSLSFSCIFHGNYHLKSDFNMKKM